jgi:hypothetical protein
MIRTSLMSDTQFAEFIKTHTVSGGKGDNTAQGAEKSQGNFTQMLQNTFATNNAQQQSQLNFLNTKLQSAINNPQGFDPQTLASMRAQANDAVAAQDQNVQRSVANRQAVQGGAAALPSGVNAQVDAEIASQAAEAGNSAQQSITEQNAQLQNQNQQRAISNEMGVAQEENPEGFASAENTSAGEVSNLSQAVTASSGPTVGSILGSVAGAGLQGWASGGFKIPGH